MEDSQILDRQFEVAYQRLHELMEQGGGSPEQESRLGEALRALFTSLEELHIAGQALRRQNEELVAARQLLEAERCQAEAQRAAALSQREAALEALRDSEERFRTLAAFAPVGIYLTDARGDCQYVNERWCEMAGLSPDEAMGQGWVKGLAEEDRERVAGTWYEMTQSQGHWGLEYRFRTPAGKTTWVFGHAARLLDGRGQLAGYVGTNVDVTERKRAEEERERLLAELNAVNEELQAGNEKLQSQAEELEVQAEELRSQADELHIQTLNLEEEQARLQAIIASAPEAILVADERGEVILANPAAERLFATPAHGSGWLTNLGSFARYRPDHTAPRPHELPLFRAAVHRETQRDIPVALPWPDGQWRDALASAVPILDSRGQAHGAVAVYQDVTERLQAERVLRVALEKYRVLVESFPLGITIADETGRILETNKEGERLLGISKAEHTRRGIGSSEWQLIRPDGSPMPAEEYASVRALREKRLVDNVEMGIVKEGGDITWLNVTAAPIPLEGYGVAVAYGDITARKRAESQREAALAQREVALKALQESEERFHSLFTSMTEGAAVHELIYDAQGRPVDFTILDVNPVYETIVERSREEVLGRKQSELFYANRPSPHLETYARVVASGQPASTELYYAPLDKHLGISVFSPGPSRFVTIFSDITERVRAEQERQQRIACLETLVRISQEILAENAVGGLMQRIVDAARELTGAGIGVSGHGYRDGAFEVGAVSKLEGGSACPPGALFTIQQGGVYMELIERATSIRLTDEELRARPAWRGLPEGHAPLRGLLGARLVGRGGQADGLIMVSDKAGGGDFTAEDEALLTQLAALASLALQHIQARGESQREAALAEQRAGELDAVFSAIAEALVVYDASGRVVRANPAAIALYGNDLPGADLAAIGQKASVRHPDGRPVALEDAPAARAMCSERVLGERILAIDAAGNEHTILASAAPLIAAGRPAGAVVVWHDATERERLLEENRRQREFLERLLEIAPIGVAVLRGPDYRYEFVNAIYQAIPGTPDVPMVGRTLVEVFPDAAVRSSLAEIESVYRTGQPISVRAYEFNVGPGRERTYWDSDRVPLKAPDGSVEGVLIVAREVTEEVLARRQVEELAARDEAILNSLTEGILTFDAQGNILMMNPAALHIYGFEQIEQAQRPLADRARLFERRTLDGHIVAAGDWPVARALRGETVRDFEAQARRVDTGRTWIGGYSCTPVRDKAGRVTMGVLTVRDITAQKEAELERERLLAELRAKNEELQCQAEELQSQTEELEAQAEELRSQTDELHYQTISLEEERARLRTIIDGAPEAILVADERGEVVLANPAAERLFATTVQGAEGPRGLGRVTRYRPDHTPYELHERPCFRAAVHKETQHEVPIALRWPDGQWRDVLVDAAPILDSHGQAHGAVAVYQDITERKQAEETNRYLAGLIERVSDAIISADTHFMIRSWNHGAEEMYGWRADEVLGRSFSELVRTNFLTMTRDQAVRELFGSGAWQGEQIQHRKDGGTINVLAATSVLKDELGNSAGVVTVNRNITERKQAETERERLLLEAGRLTAELEATFAAQNDAVLIYNIDMAVQRANPSFLATYGFDPVGLNVKDIVRRVACRDLDGRPIVLQEGPTPRALRGEAVAGVLYRVTRADGAEAVVRASSGPMRIGDRIVGSVTVWHDITELHRAENVLRETRDYLDNLLTYANAPIIVWDPSFRITRFNSAFERLTGLKAGDVLGRELDILFPEGRKEEAMAYIRRAAAGERLETVEIPIRRVDGAVRTVLWNSATLYAADGTTPVATIAQGQDITERVRAEAGLKAALAEKEVLMREIYHRVKNNLQALIYLMDMQADCIPDEATRQMIRELQERARAMALVHEKLYQSHNLAQIDFGDYLHELVDNLSRVFGTDRPIVWCIEAENALLSVDTAIPCGLVVTELLTNALKYAFPDGQPRIERGETECNIGVEFRADGGCFTLVVADNGVGLPPGLDWTTTPSLGLQLINVLARHQLGGQVEVDIQAGTAFKITFVERKKRE